MLSPELLKIFYGNIFQLLSLEDLPEDEKSALFDQMIDLLDKKLFLAIIERLEEKDQKIFADMLTSENITGEEQFEFLTQKIPNLQNVIQEEIAAFKKELKEHVDMTQAQNIIDAETR